MVAADDLFTTRRFADAVERIAERRWSSPWGPSLQERGVSLATLREKRHTVARLMVKDLLASRLETTPGRVYHLEKDGKTRRLFDFPVSEWIIHDVVADWLARVIAPTLSANLYSYQPGISYHRALREFARYVRSASSSHRGLFVLRRDVRDYFDSIPVHDGAPIWLILSRFIGPAASVGPAWALIQRTIRPVLADRRGGVYQLSRGIPTGSPVANIVANLYLSAMDEDLSHIPGGFYARYGDDMAAAHPDAVVAAEQRRMLDAHLAPQGLEFSAVKTRDLYLTTSGRASANDDSMIAAANVEFLGHSVCARGTISLSARKTRVLLDDLRTRAANSASSAGPHTEARIAGAVRAVNRFFDPDSPAAHPYAKLLRTTVTSRFYLKWLDHELALTVLEAGVGTRNIRHFRTFPPRLLRQRFRLCSLVAARNQIGRRR